MQGVKLYIQANKKLISLDLTLFTPRLFMGLILLTSIQMLHLNPRATSVLILVKAQIKRTSTNYKCKLCIRGAQVVFV